MIMLEWFQLMEKNVFNIWVYCIHSFKKNETATMFVLEKPSLVFTVLLISLMLLFSNFVIYVMDITVCGFSQFY